jgi:hypothetical protein
MAENVIYLLEDPEDERVRRFFLKLDEDLADVPPPVEVAQASHLALVAFLTVSFLAGFILGALVIGLAKGLLVA